MWSKVILPLLQRASIWPAEHCCLLCHKSSSPWLLRAGFLRTEITELQSLLNCRSPIMRLSNARGSNQPSRLIEWEQRWSSKHLIMGVHPKVIVIISVRASCYNRIAMKYILHILILISQFNVQGWINYPTTWAALLASINQPKPDEAYNLWPNVITPTFAQKNPSNYFKGSSLASGYTNLNRSCDLHEVQDCCQSRSDLSSKVVAQFCTLMKIVYCCCSCI